MKNYIEIKSMDQLNEFLAKEEKVILFFDTKLWGVGKTIFPKLMDLAENYSIKILTIDIDEQLLIKGQFLVFSGPTVIIMKSAREELRESRFINFENIERNLKF